MPRQTSSLQKMDAGEPADTIPVPRARRRRRWERRQRNHPDKMQVTFRGIPRALNEQMKGLADAENVTVSEIARLFLEYAWSEYEAGNVEIRTRTAKVKMAVEFED
jgi:hypothetical protein